jgi:hypothetical protein
MTTPKDLLESFKRLLEPKWTEQLNENQRYKILKTPMERSSELQDRLATSPIREVPHGLVPDTALSVRQAQTAKRASAEGGEYERPRGSAVRYDRNWRPKPMSPEDRDAFKIALKHRGAEPEWQVDPEAEKEHGRKFIDMSRREMDSQVQRDKEVAGRLGGQEAKRAAVNDRIQSILKRDPKAFGKLQASVRRPEPKRSYEPAGAVTTKHGPGGAVMSQWAGAPIRDPLAGKKIVQGIAAPEKLEPRELAGKWLRTKVAPEGAWGPKSADPELIPNPRKNTGGAARMVKLPGSVDPMSDLTSAQRDELRNRSMDASRDQHSELSDYVDAKRVSDRAAAEKEANRAEREKAAKSHRKAKKINDKREAEEAAAEAERARVDLHQGTFNVANLSKEDRKALIAKKAAEAAQKMAQAQETKKKDEGGNKKQLSPELVDGAKMKITALEKALEVSKKRLGKYPNVTAETIQKQQDELNNRKAAIEKGVVYAPAAPPKQVSDEKEDDDSVLDTTPIKEPQAVTDAHRAANLDASAKATRRKISHKYGLLQREPKVRPNKPDPEDSYGDRAPVMGPVESKEEPLAPELMEAFRMFKGQ